MAILSLQQPALPCLRDYEAQKRAGRKPTFDPQELGIRNADWWNRPGTRPEETP